MTDPATTDSSPPDSLTKPDRLAQDLRAVGLGDVDAYRAAFCALALAEGWSKARIGRYLGISRARVGQKVEKLHDYADARGPDSTLGHVMTVAASARPWQGRDSLIEFKADDWRDLEFCRRMCEIPGK